MKAGAVLSACGQYRYLLWRQWEGDGSGPNFQVVMLNPSTADGLKDDPTIRRCVGFAKQYGFGGLEVCNLSGYRATSPRDLAKAGFPPGPENVRYLSEMAQRAGMWGGYIVCAWGANARDKPEYVAAVCELLKRYSARLVALDFTGDGIPRHPLFVGYGGDLQPYGN